MFFVYNGYQIKNIHINLRNSYGLHFTNSQVLEAVCNERTESHILTRQSVLGLNKIIISTTCPHSLFLCIWLASLPHLVFLFQNTNLPKGQKLLLYGIKVTFLHKRDLSSSISNLIFSVETSRELFSRGLNIRNCCLVHFPLATK